MDRKHLTAEEAEKVVRTPPNDYSIHMLREWFADRASGPAALPPTSEFAIPRSFAAPPPGENASRAEGEWDVRFAPNWRGISGTTVGRFVANNLCFSRSRALREAVPYVDKPWDSKVIGELQQTAMDAMLAGEIDYEDMAWMVDRMQWLGYAPTVFVAPSMTIDTIRLPPGAKKLKKEILASPRGDKVRSGDLKELAAVESEIIAAARAELDGKDPGFEIYASGARGSVSNNYKQTAVMRGAIRKSDDPSIVSVSTASLEEGIPLDELPEYADLIVQASYGRAVMTATGGYIAKQLNMAFQSLRLDPDPRSDCRTKLTLRVSVDSPREYLFRNYVEGGATKTVLPKNLGDIKGKSVRFRSPMFCAQKGSICAACAGQMYYRMGITNIGLIANRIGTSIMAASLKSFHDTTMKMKRINFGEFCRELG